MAARPLVAVTADLKGDSNPAHTTADKYVRPVAEISGCVPVVVPALGEAMDIASLLDAVAGVVITGAISNVYPPLYGNEATEAAGPYDMARDATSLPLIEAALARGKPLFAICRGFQELNVTLGGSLHAALHELPGRLDHRVPQGDDMDVKYAPQHGVTLQNGGALAAIVGETTFATNSLHRQGIDRLADRLILEGTAEDGTIEAVQVRDARAFAFGVQWHPEYKAAENPVSAKLYQAYGQAARKAAGTS